jgi:hypothetical protein
MFRQQLLLALLLFTQSTLQCPDEKYCLSCPAPAPGKEQVCTRCESSFYNVAKKSCDSKLEETVGNCKLYDFSGDKVVCTACDYGYSLDRAKNACTKCKVEGCALCSEKDICIGCFDKRNLNRDTNTCDSKITCDLPNCDICMVDGATYSCAQCENNFALNDLLVKKCVQAPANCYMIDSADHARCLVCDYGYYITKDGGCSSNSGGLWWVWILLLLLVLALVGLFVYFRMRNLQRGSDGYTVV